MSNLTKKWTMIAADQLLGKQIVKVEYMTSEECENKGWYSRPVMFQLDDGNWIFPSQDDEGNNGGALFTNHKKEWVLPVLSVRD
tara:strand:- start:2159 stop:2410 length:252 start_codon:yes stop_codon:yes gene_type:complete